MPASAGMTIGHRPHAVGKFQLPKPERHDGMRIDYVGTAIFFAGLSFAIFRWVFRTAAEISDSPPRIAEMEEALRNSATRSARQMREWDQTAALTPRSSDALSVRQPRSDSP